MFMAPAETVRLAGHDDLVQRVGEMADRTPPSDRSAAGYERWLDEAIPAVEAALRETLPDERSRALLELLGDVVDERFNRRVALLTSVQSALAQLRAVTDLEVLFDRGVRLLCEVCGFDRALLWRVDGSRGYLERVHFPGDPDLAAAFMHEARTNPIELNHMLLETEMIRRRGPVLVEDTRKDPRMHKPLIELGGSRSYVAAPLLPSGKVIGFIHADRYDSGRDVDALDRDALFAFAEGFGYAIERTILLGRLDGQRRELRATLRSAERILDGFADAELELAQLDSEGMEAAQTAASVAATADARFNDLLTRRELDVLHLMAEGQTNARIAERLVISQTTVKSHVQNILRKLQAANRAEAVSRYMRGDPAAGSRR